MGDFDDLTKDPVDFITSCQEEEILRKKRREKKMLWDIPAIDQATTGIYPSDLYLIGGATGTGKTTFAINAALSFAQKGLKVTFFSLESRHLEMQQRIKYSLYCKYYFNDQFRISSNVRFVNWLNGELDEIFQKYTLKVNQDIQNIKTLNIFERPSNGFSIDDFEKAFLALKTQTDIYFIDHIHYFDTESDNENKEFTEITKKIRDLCLIHNRTIILLAHLRKKHNFSRDEIIPSIDDFHGSSNLTKMATHVFLIAPCPEYDVWDCKTTLLKIAKCRDAGEVTRYVFLIGFDTKTMSYLRAFKIGKIKDNKFEELQVTDKTFPFWGYSPTN